MYLTDTMTDNIDYSSTNVDRKGVAYLTLNVNNSIVKNIWGKFYAVVEQCNILIDQLEKRPELSPANSENIIAEAKFIRAWAYFNLVQLWGDVPLMTVPVYSIKEDNIRPERSSVGYHRFFGRKLSADHLAGCSQDAAGPDVPCPQRVHERYRDAQTLRRGYAGKRGLRTLPGVQVHFRYALQGTRGAQKGDSVGNHCQKRGQVQQHMAPRGGSLGAEGCER